ncbi:MAG: leucine-rich repeat protein [Bacillota bacterium]|nr:leucine-rich repeat protein [Bacillota bacterium]
MRKKPIALLLAVLMLVSLMCLSACGSADKIEGSGTEEDPWLVGADNAEDVRVVVYDSSIWIDGEGKMMDFEDPALRPWNDILAATDSVQIFGDVSYIGSNAFKGAGTNNGVFDLGIFSELEAIGSSAFAGCGFYEGSILTIPESVSSICDSAFADCGTLDVYFDGTPDFIADNAFENVTASAYVRSSGAWHEGNMLDYGGEISYTTLYAFNYVVDSGTEDYTEEGTMYVPEGQLFEYNHEDYMDDEPYHFVRYEVVEGDLVIDDPANPMLSVTITGDVTVKIVCEAD